MLTMWPLRWVTICRIARWVMWKARCRLGIRDVALDGEGVGLIGVLDRARGTDDGVSGGPVSGRDTAADALRCAGDDGDLHATR
jgi:hypothetical protein